ncbi:MAG: sigma-70 family RNA polymerase sigma factor [Deltaproteobacteria bacterium]|nr:sigma-70 family RNA polymerase sigma factor [Deltaproteobacteria bacterium]MBI4223370.1 sigma-70 family RNA polymerase sigma factor [Deltaproteobacteria bacterium]
MVQNLFSIGILGGQAAAGVAGAAGAAEVIDAAALDVTVLTAAEADAFVMGNSPFVRLAGLVRGGAAVSPHAGYLAIYLRAPQPIKGQILRGEEKAVLLKKGEMDRHLSRLGLCARDLARVFSFSEAAVSTWRTGQISLPAGVLRLIKEAENKTEALENLKTFVAGAMRDYVERTPYWEQVFTLHRILAEKKLSLISLFGRSISRCSRKLRGQRDIQAVIDIVKRDISPVEMKRKILEALGIRHYNRRVHFYREERANRALRMAPAKFQTTRRALAGWLGISQNRYDTLAMGENPVSPKRAEQIRTLEESATLVELRGRLALLPPVRPPASNGERRLGPAEAEGELKTCMARYRPLVFHMAGKGLRRFGLNSRENVEETVQDVFIALHTTLRRRGAKIEITKGWFYRVVRNKVFDKLMAVRGINKDDINFYFRMRRFALITVEALMARDPMLTLEDAEANLRRYRAIQLRMHGDVPIEDLPEGLRRKI